MGAPQIKAECPLCKQPFQSIIHNVKSNSEYDEHHILHPPQLPERDSPPPMFPIFLPPAAHSRHQFHFRFVDFWVVSNGNNKKSLLELRSLWILAANLPFNRCCLPILSITMSLGGIQDLDGIEEGIRLRLVSGDRCTPVICGYVPRRMSLDGTGRSRQVFTGRWCSVKCRCCWQKNHSTTAVRIWKRIRYLNM